VCLSLCVCGFVFLCVCVWVCVCVVCVCICGCVVCVCAYIRQAGYGSGEPTNRSDETMGIRSTSRMLRATGK
jgi:hypothetical protein